MNKKIKNRSLSMVLADTTAIAVSLAVCAILFSVGFVFANNPKHDEYALMKTFLGPYSWASLFFAYGSSRILLLLFCPTRVVLYLSSIMGITLWTITTASFYSIPGTIGPAAFMMPFLIFCEIWVSAALASNVVVQETTGTNWADLKVESNE